MNAHFPPGVMIKDVHSTGITEDGRTVTVWFDLSDGSEALLTFTPGNPPGETTSLSLHGQSH